MNALNNLIGPDGSRVTCNEPRPGVAVHYWPTNSNPGDLCLCGQRELDEPGDCPDLYGYEEDR